MTPTCVKEGQDDSNPPAGLHTRQEVEQQLTSRRTKKNLPSVAVEGGVVGGGGGYNLIE
jgi:hypothetical protein